MMKVSFIFFVVLGSAAAVQVTPVQKVIQLLNIVLLVLARR
jgi:hypothetical protein